MLNPFCPSCGTECESVVHFFCECQRYEIDRLLLRNNVEMLLANVPNDLRPNINIDNNKEYCDLLINGILLQVDVCTNLQEKIVLTFNEQLYNSIIRFLYNTARFVKM